MNINRIVSEKIGLINNIIYNLITEKWSGVFGKKLVV